MVHTIPLSSIVNRFPFCEPSYSTFVNKKVSSDFYMAVPMGKKYLAWFTHYNNTFVCIFVEVDERNGAFAMKSASIRPCCFAKELAYGCGTLVYGTIVSHKFFCIEDIFYYKGKNYSKHTPYYKLKLLKTMMDTDTDKNTELKMTDLLPTNIIFSICLMNESFRLLNEDVKNMDIKIYAIKSMYYDNFKSYKMRYVGQEIETAIFEVGAELGTDTYSLYGANKSYIGLAYIPNYKTSVLMNSLFRNIKENMNLDAIEESEDEEEFENRDNPEYFVNTEKRVIMECEYNTHFKAWVPQKVAKKGAQLSKNS